MQLTLETAEEFLLFEISINNFIFRNTSSYVSHYSMLLLFSLFVASKIAANIIVSSELPSNNTTIRTDASVVGCIKAEII